MDINDAFNDIFMTEENIAKQGYDEGYKEGVIDGNREGYKLGSLKGLELGTELGTIYGVVVAHLLKRHTPKVLRTLEELKLSIEKFPRTNNPNEDILGQIESIRSQYKKVRAMLRLADCSESSPRSDLSF